MKKPFLSFYGDDFTGSTDALEVLTWAGLNAVLFVDVPDAKMLKAHGELDAFGVAGTSRTMSPEELEEELRPILESIGRHRTPITHYKTCSTFDSSPRVGSIGRVMDIAKDYFEDGLIPVVVGAPQLGRYMLFGNLYARAGLDGSVFRLDRHPTMSVHPVTPMDDADMLAHLGRQTDQKLGLLNYLQLAEPPEVVLNRMDEMHRVGFEAIFMDVADEDQLEKIGTLLMQIAERGQPLFVVGSSGVEYGLIAARQRGEKKPLRLPPGGAAHAVPVLCVSGSCSPITADQISHAQSAGFAVLQVDPSKLIDRAAAEAEMDRVVKMAHDTFTRGVSVIVESASGPGDPRVAAVRQRAVALGIQNATRTIAEATAELTNRLVDACLPSRLVVAGGDTSSLAARRIGVQALRAIAPIAPGGPLCHAYAPGRAIDGCEVVFKGGQVGFKDFFTRAATVQSITSTV